MANKMRFRGLATLFLMLAFGVTSGFLWERTIRETSSIPLSGGVIEAISVENTNGGIEVAYINGGPPEIVVEKTGKGTGLGTVQKHLAKVKVYTKEEDGILRLQVIPPKSSWFATGSASVKVFLPNPSLMTADLSTTNGEIAVKGLRSRLSAITSNGPINVADFAGEFELITSNGEIRLENADLNPGSRARTSNGAIRGSVRATQAGSYDLTTSNASIDLELLDLTSVEIEATSSNGEIVTDGLQGLAIELARDGRLLGRTGNGDARFNLTTSNGRITLTHRDQQAAI
ncbi:MAG: DUF4097 domain-containing protein [Firmicutes bacterium]|nr:DUF4097 domain-containing protein [Bacillota bacterium]